MKKLIGAVTIACLGFGVWADDSKIKQIDVSVESFHLSLGEQKTLLGEGALGLHYFIDEGFVVLQQKPTFRALVTSSIETYAVEGPSIETLNQVHKVLEKGPKGSVDNGYIGASAGVRLPDGTFLAICHVEDQEGLPPIPGGIPGFYARVVLASSTDGKVWKKLGPIITSNKPKEYTAYQGQSDRGAADPGLVADKEGRWLYAYYAEHSRQDGRGVQICMARADLQAGFPGPGAWQKWYKGDFTEPGLGGRDTPIVSALHWDQAEAQLPEVVFSSALNKYVMILGVNFWKEYVYKTGLKQSGIYVALSDDAIHWGEPTKLLTDFAVPLEGKSLSWHGTLVFDEDSGTDGWMVYGYSPNWGHLYKGGTPHYLVGRRFHFSVEAN